MLALDLFKEIFNKLRLIKREKINNIMTFANVVIKVKYNIKHLIFIFKKKDEMHFKLYYNYFILSLSNRKFFQQKVDSFKMLTKVDSLTYKLQLSFIMRIHSMILIAQLKLVVVIIIRALN